MAVSQTVIQRNELLIRSHLLNQMKESLDAGGNILSKELESASFLVRPMVKGLYNSMVKGTLTSSTKKTIGGLLKMGKTMIENDIELDSEDFHQMLKEKFPAYLKLDQTSQQCKKDHENYPILENNIKTSFEWQLRGIYDLLQVENEKINTYRDLVRNAYDNKEELVETLEKQTNAMSYGIEVIEGDDSILNFPWGRDLMLRVLRKGFDKKISDFNEEINEFYS